MFMNLFIKHFSLCLMDDVPAVYFFVIKCSKASDLSVNPCIKLIQLTSLDRFENKEFLRNMSYACTAPEKDTGYGCTHNVFSMCSHYV